MTTIIRKVCTKCGEPKLPTEFNRDASKRKTCNLQKHAKHPIAFMQQKGFLL